MSLVNISLALLGYLPARVGDRDKRHSVSFKIAGWLRKGLTSRSYLWVGTAAVVALISIATVWSSSQRGWPNPLPGGVLAQPLAPNVRRNQDAASPAPSSISVETVTLTPQGFEPAEITSSADKFVLGVDNRIMVEELSLELLRENGQKVRQLKMAKGQTRLRKLVNLPAGRYTLQVVDHPEWRCSLVVSR